MVPVGCGWCPRVWLWQLDVFDPEVCGMIGTHEVGAVGCGLCPQCVAVAVGCDWWPTREAVAVGFGWRPRMVMTVECVWCLRVWQ